MEKTNLLSKTICLVLIFTIVGGLVFSPFFGSNLIYAQGEITDKIKKLCESKYEPYKKFGSKYLEEKYPHILYLKNCFQLFDDEEWNFLGKEKIDKYYQKHPQTSKTSFIKNYDNQNLGIETRSITELGPGNYILKARICTDDKTINEPKFFVVTDKEYFLALGNITVKANSCTIVWTYANLENQEKITLIPFNGNYIPSKYLTIKSLN